VPLAAVVVTLAAAALSLSLGGFDPLVAASAMVRGSVGSASAVLSITLVRSVPLILTGLAVALAFRAGIWNIGAEGQLYAGAVAAVWVGLHGSTMPAPLIVTGVLGASCLGGAAWTLVPALLRSRAGVGEVITTILMNFVAISLAAYVVHGPLQERRGVFPQTDAVVEGARLPILVDGTRLHLGFLIAIGAAIALWAVLRWTVVGFKIRAVGGNALAARVAGRMNAEEVALGTFLASGALAGLAGGVQVAGVTYALYEGLSPGWGYTAIAVALLAGLHPLGVVVAGLLFGALEGGAGAMQRDVGIPFAWVGAAEAMTILSVLAVDQVRRKAPWRALRPRGEVSGDA